jgi:hypothetical protein
MLDNADFNATVSTVNTNDILGKNEGGPKQRHNRQGIVYPHELFNIY